MIRNNKLGTLSSSSFKSFQFSTPTNPLIYVTATDTSSKQAKSSKNKEEALKNKAFRKELNPFLLNFKSLNNDTFPKKLQDFSVIEIPRQVRRSIERLPKGILFKIDKNKKVAVEKCLVVVSNLTSTLFREEDDERGYWKSLNSEILQEQVKKGRDNTYSYTNVLNALMYKTSKREPVIEVYKNSDGKESYQEGKYSKKYRLTETFRTKQSIINYELTCSDLIEKRTRYFKEEYSKNQDNPLFKNSVEVMDRVTLPSEEYLISVAKELIADNYTTKKGKILTLLNKKSRDYYKDSSKRSFVEENIKRFNDLTADGFIFPKIGDEKSGGRLTDSFVLMSSWARKEILIDGEPIEELDYKALHPNIAVSLYGGKVKYLTHQQVAKELNIDLGIVKRNHLSFFNMEIPHMKSNPLYEYYRKAEPEMLVNLLEDKRANGYKSASRRMFRKEVEIMTECVEILNDLGIYVLYVYDALYCKKSVAKTVAEVMNKIILKHGVYTTTG